MESSQNICCKFLFIQKFHQYFRLYHKMVILFDALSILLPATVSENCLETPGLKPFSTLCARLSCPLFVQLESFLIGKPLEFLTVSLSYENLLSRLIFTCFCFAYATVPLVFICDHRKWRIFSDPYFLSSGWMSLPISMCGLPQTSFNFPVELSHLILCDCHTMLFH